MEEKPRRETRKRYRSWPRIKGSRKTVDRAKLKEQYLANPNYKFDDFCRVMNYNHEHLRNQSFPIRSWMADWIAQQVRQQDDDVMPAAVAARKLVLFKRVQFPESWNQTAHNMKQIHNYTVQVLGEQIKHDIENKELIAAGTVKSRFKPNGTLWRDLTTAALQLQELELKALLVPPDESQKVVVPVPEKSIDEKSLEEEGDELANMPVKLLGVDPGVPAEEMAKMLGKWFDQAPIALESDMGDVVEAEGQTLEDEDQSNPEAQGDG